MAKKVKIYRVEASGTFAVDVYGYNAKDAKATFWDALYIGFMQRLADRGCAADEPYHEGLNIPDEDKGGLTVTSKEIK